MTATERVMARPRTGEIHSQVLSKGFRAGWRRPRAVLAELREGKALFAMTREHLGFLPLMVVLALLSSFFEGVGLTLVIPLVQSLGEEARPTDVGGYLGMLQALIERIPSGSRTASVLALLFATVLAKSVFSYANMAVLSLVYGARRCSNGFWRSRSPPSNASGPANC
jgi:hypothetical protein